jgi:hypothetical protein
MSMAPPPAARNSLHLRRISCEGFLREDEALVVLVQVARHLEDALEFLLDEVFLGLLAVDGYDLHDSHGDGRVGIESNVAVLLKAL